MATLEVENDQLQFLKTIKPFEPETSAVASDSPPASSAAIEDSSSTTLDDLGFPDDDQTADGR